MGIKQFSEQVKAFRAALNLSQEELAHALGVSFAMMNRWERCVNGEDVAWDNMVACFPRPGAQHPGFGAVEGDFAAATTIDKLNLNCKRLCEARKSAIMKAGLHKRAENPMKSESKVRCFIQNISKRQGNRFIEFCTVLEHAASDYIQELYKRAQRKRHTSAR